MTFTQTSDKLRIDAQLLTGLQIEEVTAFRWVKDAMRYIVRNHFLAAPITTITFHSEGTDEDPSVYEFEKELIMFERMTKHKMRRAINQPYYIVTPEGIEFYHKGDFDVTFRYMPDDPATVTTPIPIPDRYAEAIKFYVAARIRSRIYGQGDTDAQGFDQMFYAALDEADATTDRSNKRFRQMPARY